MAVGSQSHELGFGNLSPSSTSEEKLFGQTGATVPGGG